jgi:hypothetical protein
MDMDVGGARDPRVPEKEKRIRRRLKGPGAVAAKTRRTTVTNSSSSSSKSGGAAHKAAVPAPASASKAELTVELERVGGAASRLVAARGSGGGGRSTVSGPRRVLVDNTEAAAGMLARPVLWLCSARIYLVPCSLCEISMVSLSYWVDILCIVHTRILPADFRRRFKLTIDGMIYV